MKAFVGAERQAREAQALIDRALGYPRRGIHVGRGTHVVMPQLWDGNGEPPPGWTSTLEPVWVNGDALIQLEDDLVDATIQALPAADRAAFQAIAAARVEVEGFGSRTPKPQEATTVAPEAPAKELG